MLLKARQGHQTRQTTPGGFRGNMIGLPGKPVRFSRNGIFLVQELYISRRKAMRQRQQGQRAWRASHIY